MMPTSTHMGSRNARWDGRVGCLLALVLTLAMTFGSHAQTETGNVLITPMFVGGIERMPKPQKHLGCLGVIRDQQLPVGSRVQVFIYDSEPQTAIIEELIEVSSSLQKVRDLGFQKARRSELWPKLACPWRVGRRGSREAAVFRTDTPIRGWGSGAQLIGVADVPNSAIVLGRTTRSLGDQELDTLHKTLTDAVPDLCRTPGVLRSGTVSARVNGHEMVDFRLGVPSYGPKGEIDSIQVCRFMLHNGVLLSQWNWSRTSGPFDEEYLGVLGPALTKQTWSQTTESVLGFIGWEAGRRWRMIVVEGAVEGTSYKALDLESPPKVVWEERINMG